MSWFTTFNVGELAKTALSEAQKKIDKALDIEAKNEAQGTEQSHISSHSDLKFDKASQNAVKTTHPRINKDTSTGSKSGKAQSKATDDFFAAWGDENLGVKVSPRSKQSHKSTTHVPASSNVGNVPSPPKAEDRGKLVMSDSDIEVLTPGWHMHDDAILSDQSNTENRTQTSYDTFSEVPLTESDDTKCESKNIPVDACDDFIQNSFTTEEINCSNHVEQSRVVEQVDEAESSNNKVATSTIADHADESAVEITEPSVLLNTHNATENDDTSVNNSPEEKLCLNSVTEADVMGEGLSATVQHEFNTIEVPDDTAVGVLEDNSQKTLSATDSMIRTSDEITLVPPSEAGRPTYKSDTTYPANKSDSAVQPVLQGVDDNYLALAEKMEVYEQQLMTLSQRNASLNEENDNLKSEITRTRNECKRESERELKEATESLKSYETACTILEEEKANLAKQFNVLKSQLAARMTHDQVQSAIAEKEESIKGLMEEGEVLAKKHLQQNNLIKKLKSQAQERESELKSVKEKFQHYETENSKLKEELRIIRGQGKEQRETSIRISDAYEQRERETQILQEKLAQSEEKQRTLQVNLDGAYKEIGDLHKQIAEQESKVSSEWDAKEADIIRSHELDKKKILSDQEHQRQLLMIQILELTNSMSRAETNTARRDDDHRREVKELQQRIQESEGRNQDLSDNVTGVTRPLLRQIENLQATHSTQQRSWNALEKTLNYRLAEAQTDLMAARESERLAQSMSIECKSKVQALEKQIENDRKIISNHEQDIASMQKQLEERKVELEETMQELDKLNAIHKESLHKSRKERLFLENQLQMEKVRSETERRKQATQLESFQKERDKLMWSRSEITSISSNQVAETESVSSLGDAFQGTDETHTGPSSLPGLTNQLSFEGGRAVSISNVLENLQTQVKLREGEIAQLRGEINMLERTRSSMAEEIVRLTNLNEDMEGVSQELQDTQVKLADIESRYAAILTMYGEKQEENEELKMDLADVKAMYRQQINDLLRADTS